MDLKSTIDIILKDLKEARDIMDDLKNYPDVPEIQIELAKAKCRSAGEVLKFLTEETKDEPRISSLSQTRDSSSTTKGSQRQTTKGEEEKEAYGTSEKAETDMNAEPEAKPEEDTANDVIPEEEKSTEEIIDHIIQPESIKDQPDSTIKESGSGKILADKFSKESSINEQIASKRHDKGGDEVSKLKPVSNLAEAIGINDRFQYVRELFNGDQDLYRQTITSLNNATDIDEAFDILSSATGAEKDDQSFDQLLDLVKRKLRTA